MWSVLTVYLYSSAPSFTLEGYVKALLNLTLPRMGESKEAVMPPHMHAHTHARTHARTHTRTHTHTHTHSMPHMSSSSGYSIPVSPPLLNFRSLVTGISMGEGNVEYKETESPPNEDDSISVHRERGMKPSNCWCGATRTQ